MGVRMYFDLCHPEGPEHDLTRDTLQRILEAAYADENVYCESLEGPPGWPGALALAPDVLAEYDAGISSWSGADSDLLECLRRAWQHGIEELSSSEATRVFHHAFKDMQLKLWTPYRETDGACLYASRWVAPLGSLAPRAAALWSCCVTGRSLWDRPGPREAELLDQLVRDPDDGTRVVYADWLESIAQIDRARFVRLVGQERTAEEEVELGALAPRFDPEWRHRVTPPDRSFACGANPDSYTYGSTSFWTNAECEHLLVETAKQLWTGEAEVAIHETRRHLEQAVTDRTGLVTFLC